MNREKRVAAMLKFMEPEEIVAAREGVRAGRHVERRKAVAYIRGQGRLAGGEAQVFADAVALDLELQAHHRGPDDRI